MLHEIESLMEPPPPKPVRLLGSLGATVILFNEVRHQLPYIYAFVYLSLLELNRTVCK